MNADDFGLTPGVNRSVTELHSIGALSSATLMARAKQTDAAIASVAAHPDLGVGCHVVLVDGVPVLPANQITSLALPEAAFRPTLGRFVRDLLRGHIPAAEIEREALAQIRRLQSAGVHVTHLDTHKHTHMFPGVLRPLLLAALQCGIRAVRNPFEPDWSLKATLKSPAGAPMMRRMQVRLLRSLRREFLKLVEGAGMTTTDGAIGVLATGTLDSRTINALLEAMPTGTWELVCHPGYVDAELQNVRTRLRDSRAVEHEALARVVPEVLRNHPDLALIHFGQLGAKNQ